MAMHLRCKSTMSAVAACRLRSLTCPSPATCRILGGMSDQEQEEETDFIEDVDDEGATNSQA